jgi:DNA-binding NarL/FixJ family response regulator
MEYPTAVSTLAPALASVKSPSRSANKIISVWLVDSCQRFRDLVARALDKTDDLVCRQTFEAAEAALAALAEVEAPNVVLMDVVLPGINGIDAAAQFRSLSPQTQIILLTSSDDPERVSGSIQAGASGYLLKSAPLGRVAESIRDVHAGGASLNPMVTRSVLEMLRRLTGPRKDYGFTPRERKILELMTQGLLVKEIADQLTLSYHTVDTHLRNIYAKLRVHTRTGAVAKVLKEHLF